MMSVRQLIIGSVTVPVWASLNLTQHLDPVEATYSARKKGGGFVKRTIYTGKHVSRMSGGGPAPSGLQELDTSTLVSLHCIKALSINSASNVITIPANRRADAGSEPFGFAVVGDAMVATPVAMAVDEATLTIVPGASAYQVRFFPILTVICEPVNETLDRGTGYRWTMDAEEV